MAPKPETVFWDKTVKPALKDAHLRSENMAGGLYQSGIPDKLIVVPGRRRPDQSLLDGRFVFVELKYFRNNIAPSGAGLLVACLEGRQLPIVISWAAVRTPVYVLAGSAQERCVTWVNPRQIREGVKNEEVKSTKGTMEQFIKELRNGNLDT